MARKYKRTVFGTLRWGGTYDGKPAFTSCGHGYASLWVFDSEWKEIIVAGCTLDLHNALGLPWRSDQVKQLFSK